MHAPGSDTSRAASPGTRRNRDCWLLWWSQAALSRCTGLVHISGMPSPAYDSWASPSALSSMLMSLSSLDSKTSRHSRHSTNSASSSRLTICTRGCLQGCLAAFWGWENGFELINPDAPPLSIPEGTDSREFPGILDLLRQLSSPSALHRGEFLFSFPLSRSWPLRRTPGNSDQNHRQRSKPFNRR